MYEGIEREQLEEKLAKGDDFALVEVLDPEEYRDAHIKGAVNIPLEEIGKEAKKRFSPGDEIVVYCASSSCAASPAAAKKLDRLGFNNVYDYEEGKEGWLKAGNETVSGEDPE
ncbi:MAG: rhodanese-like domain-containing protein [Candidatus Bipolaricaulota bacterium]